MNQAFEVTVHTPPGLETGKTYPAIIALHGIGYNEKDMLSVIQDVGDEYILIGVRGHLTYQNGYAYYVLKGYGNPDRGSFDTSVEMLQHFVEDISAHYPIDLERMYITGFSQGAILSMTLALTLGTKLKGVAAMNGYIPAFVKEEYPLQPANHLSVYVSDGKDDPIFPPRIGEENYRYFKERAASVRYRTFDAAHTISEENQKDLVAWFREEARQQGR